MPDTSQTADGPPVFDFDAYPADTCFYDRRSGRDRRSGPRPDGSLPTSTERRVRKDRRRRVDPTTYEKQYTARELEFMNAMQDFKMRSGKMFPSHGEVLRVARALGYQRVRRPGPLPGTPIPPEAPGQPSAGTDVGSARPPTPE